MGVYRSKPDYSTRPGGATWLGRILLALTLLLGLASAAFLLFFRGYVTETGGGLALHAPFLSPEARSSVLAGGTATVTLPESTPCPEPLQAVLLPMDCVEDGSAVSELRRAGGNAVVLTMKAEDGTLSYVSDLPLAIESGASAADPERNDAIRLLNAQCYSIAQVSCLQDPLLTQLQPALAMQRLSGSPWRDELRRAWLSPWQQEVQTYLLDICQELAALGFDEILLTDCAFPVDGRQDLLREPQDQDALLRQTALESLYSTLSQGLLETGVTLSIRWSPSPEATEEAASETQEDLPANGLRLDTALLYGTRLWVDADEATLQQAADALGLEFDALPVVSISAEKRGSLSAWATF